MTRLAGFFLPLLIAVAVLAKEPPTDEKSSAEKTASPRMKMETTLGDIILELDDEKAPITVLNFLKYAEDDYYEGTIFHRVMKGFMIQGGGFTPEMEQKKEGLREPIRLEADNGLSNVPGTIAMARMQDPNSATSQFYINVVDNTGKLDYPLNGGYTVFGKVVEGMDTVEKIRNVEVTAHAKYRSPDGAVTPVEPVVIKSVSLANEYDLGSLENRVAEIEAKAKEEEAKANKEIMDKIEKVKKEGTTTDSGLMYYEVTVGEGKSPEPTSVVEVHYSGHFLDGKKFDSSYDRKDPAKFPLNRVIKGWTEGVGGMKVGGKRYLVIPPDLAYGAQGRPGIPPNSTLFFEVELLAVP